MKTKLSQFVLDTTTNIYKHPQYEDFKYSDGKEVEERIFEILSNAKDRSLFSVELQNAISDWPTEYHFSPFRHNLLRHFHFKKTDHILELGCGCGAITRQLGESGAKVDAIEGSLNRAKSAAARCKDINNVHVFAGNFQDIAFENTYDYVIMVGAFEYSPTYFFDDNPESACLKIVKSALKPEGKLIIAIENRLGLKYLTGFEEDHTGIPFLGIQDLYKSKTVRTYGKHELENLLKNNGFSFVQFQYPFPDYKIPSAILTQKAFDCKFFRHTEIIKQLASRNYSGKGKPHLSETLIWPVLDKNLLMSDLANSFLVITQQEAPRLETDHHLLAIKYTMDRVSKYNTRTEFVLNKTGRISVIKSSLQREPDVIETDLIHCPSDEIYYEGVNLDTQIDKMIRLDDFKGYINCIKQWLSFIMDHGIKSVNEANIFSSLVLPEFFDCIPPNLIVTDKGLVLIDKEWKVLKDFTITTLLLRYFVYEKNISFINRHLKGHESAVAKIMQYMNIKIDQKILEDYQILNKYIDSKVYARKMTDLLNPSTHNDCKYFILKVKEKARNILRRFYGKTVTKNKTI